MSSLRLHAPRSQTCFPFCQLTPPPQLAAAPPLLRFLPSPRGLGLRVDPSGRAPSVTCPSRVAATGASCGGRRWGRRRVDWGHVEYRLEGPGCCQGTRGTPSVGRQSGEGRAVLLGRAWPRSPGLG